MLEKMPFICVYPGKIIVLMLYLVICARTAEDIIYTHKKRQ